MKKKDESAENVAPDAPADAAAEWRDKYLRALAELDNYRKRTERDREIARTYATESLLRDVLPVLDDLERALAIDASDAIREGIALALRHLVRVLESKGMKPIEALGLPFDPRFHEAAGVVPAGPGRPPGAVVEELRKGYVFHDRVLRPARVQIAMAAPAVCEDEEGAGGPT